MFTSTLTEHSTDTLEQALGQREAAISALRAQQAEIVAELDARQTATADGSRTMAEWVAARCDITPENARALVTASRLLADHPRIAKALDAGHVSFDRALATAKLAAAGASETALDASGGYDLGGVARMAAAHRRVTRLDERQAHAGRYVTLQPSLDRSHWKLSGQLPGVDGDAVDAVLTTVGDALPTPPHGSRPGRAQRRADALVKVCQDAADQPGTDDTGGRPRPRPPHVEIFVNADLAAPTNGQAGAATAAGVRVGPDTLEEILCDGTVGVTAIQCGKPYRIDVQRRTLSEKLRRYIHYRDRGTCAVDGCQSRYRLQPHHIVPRSQGGSDDPDNLVLLCWYHHHVVVHGMGYRIDPESPPQRRRFLGQRGREPPG